MKIKVIFAKIKEFLKGSYEKNKKLFIVSLALVLIVLVSGYFVFFGEKKADEKTLEDEQVVVGEYASKVENKIESLLLNLKQIDKVEVVVMVDSSPEKVYLTETETVEISNQSGTTTTTTTKVVYKKEGSISSPIEIKIVYPKIKGVLIFINKVDASTKLAIANSVASVLNIESSCINILQDR